jgi:superfamily II DNA or RNA helicase
MKSSDTVLSENKYIDLTSRGRIFPLWLLKNFKKYKLPPIIRKDDEDPCSVTSKMELHKYQQFIGEYLGPKSLYNGILLYHGLGSGKTATAINFMNIIYNYSPDVNFIILIKASIHDDPWIKDLKLWLGVGNIARENSDAVNINNIPANNNINIIHYDSPYANKDFKDVIKKLDTNKRFVYIIDEVHNFIRNVYSNTRSKTGKRAKDIYDMIVQDKKERPSTKVVAISATPVVNEPFELSLLFNMIEPGIFPSTELEFNRLFISGSSYPILSPATKNMFNRRILSLVSYYAGLTPGLFAEQKLEYVSLEMSAFQYNAYKHFEIIEENIEKKVRKFGKQSQLYRVYTRQACNFVFPDISTTINSLSRPRPSKFKLDEKNLKQINSGEDEKDSQQISAEAKDRIKQYIKITSLFISETERYFNNIKSTGKGNIMNDAKEFSDNYEKKYDSKFVNFHRSDYVKSDLYNSLYECSPKMLAIAFYSFCSPGKVMIYTNYVLMEGIDIQKIYLKMLGFNDYKNSLENMGFCEYHGRMDKKERLIVKTSYNNRDNIKGNRCKIILLSPSATEGIQLYNVRQEHVLEPYWNEVRIQQVLGRGIRQCSHKDLPMSERVVNIFRYKCTRPRNINIDTDTLTSTSTPTSTSTSTPAVNTDIESDSNKKIVQIKRTADEYIEDLARAKYNLNESFLLAMRESAVDCELNKNHNMIRSPYNCFKFPESSVMSTNIGPAYVEDIKEDIKNDIGLNAKNSSVKRIKVIKIKAVFKYSDDNYSDSEYYYYNPETGMAYDRDLYFPVGQVEIIDDLPNKLNKDTYIISTIIQIPSID